MSYYFTPVLSLKIAGANRGEKKRSLYSLLVGIEVGPASVENSMEISQVIKTRLIV